MGFGTRVLRMLLRRGDVRWFGFVGGVDGFRGWRCDEG